MINFRILIILHTLHFLKSPSHKKHPQIFIHSNIQPTLASQCLFSRLTTSISILLFFRLTCPRRFISLTHFVSPICFCYFSLCTLLNLLRDINLTGVPWFAVSTCLLRIVVPNRPTPPFAPRSISVPSSSSMTDCIGVPSSRSMTD